MMEVICWCSVPVPQCPVPSAQQSVPGTLGREVQVRELPSLYRHGIGRNFAQLLRLIPQCSVLGAQSACSVLGHPAPRASELIRHIELGEGGNVAAQ